MHVRFVFHEANVMATVKKVFDSDYIKAVVRLIHDEQAKIQAVRAQ